MNIYVCVKHVPDSAARIAIIDQTNIDERVTFILNPYDENAVAEAVKLKETLPNSEIIAVAIGKSKATETLRSSLAMGADRGIHVITETQTDSILTAKALKFAIQQDGNPNIIFTGKESIDSEGMQTMFRLASELKIPIATNVVDFENKENSVLIKSEVEASAKDVIEMDLPCIVATGKGLNKPKYPTLLQIVKSKKKEIKTIKIESLISEQPTSGVEILELKEAVEERKGKELTGTPEEVVDQLVDILKNEAKII
jgi:electron transfer flavoprotein beta subunit